MRVQQEDNNNKNAVQAAAVGDTSSSELTAQRYCLDWSDVKRPAFWDLAFPYHRNSISDRAKTNSDDDILE